MYTLMNWNLRDPAIVIRKDSITFNTACITGLEDVVYVHVMFNNDLKRIVVRGCDENDKDALRWCVAKPDKRKSRKMSCKPFATLVYNRKMKQIAVQACGAEESGAHRVGKPDESNSGEIKCMALVRMIYGDSGWDKKMSYRLIGRAFPQQRLVSFKITDAMQIENGRVLTEM